MKQKAIYPGTFDPITNGHIDLIQRAAKIFPELIVAVASNTVKNPFIPLTTRIQLIEEALKNTPGIEVVGFNTLLIDFVREKKAQIILNMNFNWLA
jgi:pantetheine-phosphate adenylyltransferase